LVQIFKGKSGGILAGLAAGALWGLVFVAPRMVLGSGGDTTTSARFNSVDLTAGRFLSYGLIAAVLMLIGLQHRKIPTVNQALAALGLSLLGFTGYYLLLVLAIKDAGTEMPALIVGTIPIWVMFLGKQQGLSFRNLLPGLLLTLAGLLLMGYAQFEPQVHGLPSAENAVFTHYWRGIAYAVVSMVCWTVFAILNSAWLKRHPEVSAADWANWLGVATGLGAWVLWLFVGSNLNTMTSDPKFASFALMCIATGIGSAWLATIFWNIASQRLSASLCGQLIVSETVFALVYSAWWDGRLPDILALFAAVLFVLGILASIKAHR
jgi:drug/metabolite transporter (DMT)-like permease